MERTRVMGEELDHVRPSSRILLGVTHIGGYHLVERLAVGGMGTIYLARATGLGAFERRVVLKTLEPSFAEDEAYVTMFLDEARIAGAMHHQHIAPVLAVGRDERGGYYLVMDYVPGETVEAIYQRAQEWGVAIPLDFAVTVGVAIGSALAYAHELCDEDGTPLGIVHRDVSLSNVIAGHDGGIKLIDFGIAKANQRTTTTVAGTLKGKLGYLAPEQVRSGPIDHRADQFSLAVVIYELTTRRRAFLAASDFLTLERTSRAEITAPSELVPGYPRELEQILLRALAPRPADRYPDMRAFTDALEDFAASRDLALGDRAVTDTLERLFAVRGRRRLARGSDGIPTETQDSPTTRMDSAPGDDTETRDDATVVSPPVRHEIARPPVVFARPAPARPEPTAESSLVAARYALVACAGLLAGVVAALIVR